MDRLLILVPNASQQQLATHADVIDGFQESWAQTAVHFYRCPNNLGGQLIRFRLVTGSHAK
jgi:hypothetical protein